MSNSDSPVWDGQKTHKSKPNRVSIENSFKLWQDPNHRIHIYGLSQDEYELGSTSPSSSKNNTLNDAELNATTKVTKNNQNTDPPQSIELLLKNQPQLQQFIEGIIEKRLYEKENNSNSKNLQNSMQPHPSQESINEMSNKNINSFQRPQTNQTGSQIQQHYTQQVNTTNRVTFDLEDNNAGMDALLSQFEKPPDSNKKHSTQKQVIYTPSNIRLIPIQKTLEVQLEAIRQPLETICSKCLMDTKNIHAKTKVIQLWKEPLTPPLPTNDLNDPDEITTLPEELFIPKYLHLDKIQITVKQSLLESEEFQDQVNTLKHRFEIAKNKI